MQHCNITPPTWLSAVFRGIKATGNCRYDLHNGERWTAVLSWVAFDGNGAPVALLVSSGLDGMKNDQVTIHPWSAVRSFAVHAQSPQEQDEAGTDGPWFGEDEINTATDIDSAFSRLAEEVEAVKTAISRLRPPDLEQIVHPLRDGLEAVVRALGSVDLSQPATEV